MAKKKTYREKINEVEEKIHDITPEWEEKLGKGKILIPNAIDIERIINNTKKGELLTNDTIRAILTKEKNVQVTAAIPTGVYLKYIALAAEEEKELNKTSITPYWRVLRPDGSLNTKFPISINELTNLLENEGHKLELGKGKKSPKVIAFESKIRVYK
ncbi:hypothetical protein D7030_04545 [Flavobacteriaceae bacterium AU392]|nr:hypothetical protein D1817_11020 [Flavobacteriaceae bacterium]RKM85945.1 hypothetical protein D7030_04545 [Flavobacteriaceae bacterium AU392]